MTANRASHPPMPLGGVFATTAVRCRRYCTTNKIGTQTTTRVASQCHTETCPSPGLRIPIFQEDECSLRSVTGRDGSPGPEISYVDRLIGDLLWPQARL